jgi:DNA topoisomerase VI subunit A
MAKKRTTTSTATKSRRSKRHARGGDTGGKLVGFAQDIAQQVAKQQDPGVEIPVRALSNVDFSQKQKMIVMGRNTQRRSFFNVGMAKKFMQTTLGASGCKELIEQAKTTSIRDLFYHCKHFSAMPTLKKLRRWAVRPMTIIFCF